MPAALFLARKGAGPVVPRQVSGLPRRCLSPEQATPAWYASAVKEARRVRSSPPSASRRELGGLREETLWRTGNGHLDPLDVGQMSSDDRENGIFTWGDSTRRPVRERSRGPRCLRSRSTWQRASTRFQRLGHVWMRVCSGLPSL